MWETSRPAGKWCDQHNVGVAYKLMGGWELGGEKGLHHKASMVSVKKRKPCSLLPLPLTPGLTSRSSQTSWAADRSLEITLISAAVMSDGRRAVDCILSVILRGEGKKTRPGEGIWELINAP